MGDNTRIVLTVAATVLVLMGIGFVGAYYLKGNTPIIMMVVAAVVSVMLMALAGVYLLNKAVKD